MTEEECNASNQSLYIATGDPENNEGDDVLDQSVCTETEDEELVLELEKKEIEPLSVCDTIKSEDGNVRRGLTTSQSPSIPSSIVLNQFLPGSNLNGKDGKGGKKTGKKKKK